MQFYAILLLQKPLRILHQIINFEIKKFFSNLNSYYALIIKFCRCGLLLIKFNRITTD